MKKTNNINLKEKSEEIREKIINYHSKTGRHHIGSSLSAVEILTSLYYKVMGPEDRFILSKGHASSVLYTILNDKGLINNEDLYNLEEHPKINKDFGIYASTGSLGHGLSIGMGIALANKKRRVFVLLGDGECDEGQIWEAARDAFEYKTNNLTAIIDGNRFQGFKENDYSSLVSKFSSFGWNAQKCDGHDVKELCSKLIHKNELPSAIIAKTIKGKGIKSIEDTLGSHYYHFK